MEYRTIGETGIRVSSLCFGTMSFGGIAGEEISKAMFDRCREEGINFFDCANVYNKGKAEEILGKCIADCRDEVVITSKAGLPVSDGINDRGASRRHLFLEVEKSLKRLGTDRIDFYFIHKFDGLTDIEETVRALDDLQRQGKILYPAVSNWAAWQIAKALGISDKNNLAAFKLIQPMYNVVKRQAEVELLPFAKSENLGVISYSPLGGGLLTGKYGTDKKPDKGRLVDQKNYKARYGSPAYYETADAFVDFAKEIDVPPASLAVAWVARNEAVTAPIIGARNLEQLKDSLGSLAISLPESQWVKLSSIIGDLPLATDHSRME